MQDLVTSFVYKLLAAARSGWVGEGCGEKGEIFS